MQQIATQPLERFITEYQTFVSCDLRQEIFDDFEINSLTDLSVDQMGDVINHVQWIVNLRLSAAVLEQIIPEFLKAIGENSDCLAKALVSKLQRRLGEKFWAMKTPNVAFEYLWLLVGNTNIWEFTFKPSEEVSQ